MIATRDLQTPGKSKWEQGTAGPSTTLRSGRDDKFVRKQGCLFSNRIVIPTGADPDFLHRGTTSSHVCGFPYRKPHEACQRHQAQQEIRGRAVEGPAVSLSGSLRQRRWWGFALLFRPAYALANVGHPSNSSSLFCFLYGFGWRRLGLRQVFELFAPIERIDKVS